MQRWWCGSAVESKGGWWLWLQYTNAFNDGKSACIGTTIDTLTRRGKPRSIAEASRSRLGGGGSVMEGGAERIHGKNEE
jgi:hypothetical protein